MRCGDINYRLFGFIAWLKREVEQKGWDQKKLSERSGRSEAEIRRVFQGSLAAGALRDIAKALGISLPAIFLRAISPEVFAQKRETRKAARLLNSHFKKRREAAERKLDEMLSNAW
jgi:transcriptional regulator with XRE-family HTH domain